MKNILFIIGVVITFAMLCCLKVASDEDDRLGL